MLQVPRSLRLRSSLLALVLLAVACQSSGEREFSSARDLVLALQDAGAEVEQTALVAPQLSEAATGRTLDVGGSLVYVFEFEEAAQASGMAATIDPQGRTLAGAPLPWSDPVALWVAGRLLVAYEGTDGGLTLLLSGLLGDPLTVSTEMPQEPYPPAVTAALLACAEALSVDPGTIEVVGYLPAEWAGSCLGLPEEDEACAEVIIPGWQIDLRAGGQEVTAHTDELGLQVRLAFDG